GTLYLRDVDLREGPRRAHPAPVAKLAQPAVGLRATAIWTRAPVDDDGHVRVFPVVRDHLVEELRLELTRNYAIDHCQTCPTFSLYERIGWYLPRGLNLRVDAAPLLETGVPLGELRVQLARLHPPLGEADGLRRVAVDPVLVPGDLPDEREHDVRVRPGERDDADPRF